MLNLFIIEIYTVTSSAHVFITDFDVVDLHRLLNTDEHTVKEQLKFLYDQNLIKEMEPGKWVRKVLDQKTGQLFFFFHCGVAVASGL